MNDLINAVLGVKIPALQDAVAAYWIVPAGLVVLYYYGRHHFNSPDYALSGSSNDRPGEFIRGMPLSKLRGMAPPIFTTSRARYQRYMWRYVALLQTAFLLIVFCPDLTRYAVELWGHQVGAQFEKFPIPPQERGVWALFLLSGLLSSVPPLKSLDAKILSSLHRRAEIPQNAEVYAQCLFAAGYAPTDAVSRTIRNDIKTKHLRHVVEGRAIGSLEDKWFDLRCMCESIKSSIFEIRNTNIYRVLGNDFDEIEAYVFELKKRIVAQFRAQDASLPDHPLNIDEYMNAHLDQDPWTELARAREQLEIEVEAITLRLCRLCALTIFATESKPENMTARLRDLGYQVRVEPVPRWHWEAIAKVSIACLAAILIPSALYGIAINDISIGPGELLPGYIPNRPMDVLQWALMGTLLHTISVVIALMTKRHYARLAIENSSVRSAENHNNENLVAALTCYAGIVSLQALFVFRYLGTVWPALFWAALPAISGHYVGKYIDKSRENKPVSNLRACKQAGVMFVASLTISVALLIPNFAMPSPNTAVWVFIVYCATVAGLIGLTIGQIFQRSYSHNELTKDIALTHTAAQDPNTRVIGDFLVSSEPPSYPAVELKVVGGMGI